MTVEEIASNAQDGLLELMNVIKMFKEEIVRLNKENAELKQQVEDSNLTETTPETVSNE